MEEAEAKTADLEPKTIETVVSSNGISDVKKNTGGIWPVSAVLKIENGDSTVLKMSKGLEKNKMPKEFSMQNLSKINALSRMTTELNMGLTMTNKE